jgi:hypothetical protein
MMLVAMPMIVTFSHSRTFCKTSPPAAAGLDFLDLAHKLQPIKLETPSSSVLAMHLQQATSFDAGLNDQL